MKRNSIDKQSIEGDPMFKDITIQELRSMTDNDHTIVDVRSPKEYQEATIPGSVNIPVFTNAERAEIGTLYKQVSADAAKERGLQIFSQKLPAFIKEFQAIETPITLFCWRGGMRSKAAATTLSLMDVHVNRLQGGIRSYRQWVVSELEKEHFPPTLYVLEGYTGTGKTVILEKLAADGYPVINLEKLAGYRGSIFGQIGMHPNNQKTFDALLVEDFMQYTNEPFVFIEGESKRIGKVIIPEFLYRKKEHGVYFMIHMPMEERINNILREYHPEDYPEKFIESFQYVKKRIHMPIAKQIEIDLKDGAYPSAIQRLLENYYDPMYDHANKSHVNNTKEIIYATTIADAYEQIKDILQQAN